MSTEEFDKLTTEQKVEYLHNNDGVLQELVVDHVGKAINSAEEAKEIMAKHAAADEVFQTKMLAYMKKSDNDRREIMLILKGDGVYSNGMAQDVKDMKGFYQKGKYTSWLVGIGAAVAGLWAALYEAFRKG